MFDNSDEFWSWVHDHRADDPTKLRLASSRWPFPWIDEAIGQIQRSSRAKSKLPTYCALDRFYFPTDLIVEQSTSELFARYHASLVPQGTTVADLTAGLGIDAMAIARRASSVVAVERDKHLADALSHNAKVAGVDNLTVVNADCREWIRDTDLHFDIIFIDPARRGDNGERVFNLAQCEPNVVELLPTLMDHCDRLIVKASPMLDLSATSRSLPGCSHLISLGSKTECKELVAIVEKTSQEPPVISAVTLFSDGEVDDFSFTAAEETSAEALYGVPAVGDTMYIPYPAVMKSGAVKLLSSRFRLFKPHNNTHLYFGRKSQPVCQTFPGERYLITEAHPYASSVIKRLYRRVPVALVSTRNMGLSADQLRSKLKIKDGGDTRVVGITAQPDQRMLLVAQRP